MKQTLDTEIAGSIRRAPYQVIGGFVVAIIGASFTSLPATRTMDSLAAGFMITWVGVLISCRHSKFGSVGASSAYLVVFGLFHGGLVIATSLVDEAAFVGLSDNSWITASNLKPSVEIVTWCMLAFTVGSRLAPRIRVNESPEHELLVRTRLTLVGKILVPVGLLLVGKTVLSGGFGIITSGYGEFFAAAAGRQFAFGISFVMTGCGLLISSGGRDRRLGWIIFSLLALVALPIGLRGPLLFPAIAFAIVEGRQRRITWAAIAPVLAAVLILTSVLRQTRLGGIRALIDFKGVALAPIQGVSEMGYSIRPVVVVREWMAAGLDPQYGITLVAPVIRVFERLTGTAPANSDVDFRLFNVEVFTRVGPIGGSPVAEGLRNGGVIFAVLLLFALGMVFGAIDNLPHTPIASAAVVLILTPLLINARNSFAPVAAQWLIAAIVLFFALRVTAKQSERPVSGP